MKIYLDNCCFNRPYDDQPQLGIHLETEAKLFVQELIFKKELDLVWSYVLDFENRRNPFDERRIEILLWRDLASMVVPPHGEIVSVGKGLESSGLKPLDALHVACAIYGKCKAFLTVDRGILKKKDAVPGIKIVSPIEFLDVLKES